MSKLNMAELLAKARAAKKEGQVEKPPFTPDTEDNKSLAKLKDVLNSETPKKPTLAQKLAALRAKNKPATPTKLELDTETKKILGIEDTQTTQATGMSGEEITYNREQLQFIKLISFGESCVLIGSAGTGKTTSSQGGIKELVMSGIVPILQAENHKHLKDGSSGIIIISYTRRAVNNIRKVQSAEFKNNCLTAHKLLEYAPVYYELYDELTGTERRTMRFEPSRNASNPIPSTVHTIIVEEASMMSLDLFNEIEAACPHKVQWIFIGDIQQLPPIFGPAILGFKLLELPVVELKEVYRQALKSPIIRLAQRILSGKPIPVEEFDDWKEDGVDGALTIHPWRKKLSPENACLTLAAFFKAAIEKGIYDPYEDMILMPFNKACGTLELNKSIANFLARKKQVFTYEIMAGFNKVYFSEGDKVMYDREDAEIISIEPNPTYSGARVQPHSLTLDYWGFNPNLMKDSQDGFDASSEEDIDFLLAAVASDSEDRVTQASHKVVVRLQDTGAEITLSKAAEINALLHSYALTVHKAQGSEWRKVFFLLHQSHATMLQRELLYTGVTRAREELYIICEPESLTKGILSQKIKGSTLAEKAEYFKGKLRKLA